MTSSANPTFAELELTLHLTDAELCTELSQHPEGRARHEYAAGALKIGALALRQAQGRIDAEHVRAEGDRLIENLGSALAEHQRAVTGQVSTSLKEYFDPQSGRFNERIERLVRKDGDLERVLRSQIGGDGSELARTLASHVGEHSPLMHLLDPAGSEGLLGSLATALEKTLGEQRERILSEFSLDNDEGALARLVAELTQHHGEMSEALEKRIDAVVGEFSLDREDSALSRLVGRVEQTQRQISSEFSLDQEGSALARMRRELLEIAEMQSKANERFYGEVLEKLAEMTARKQEAARSTRHGEEFEKVLFAWIEAQSQRAGDIATFCGNQVGRIKNCKTGDVEIELGTEHVAAGARIVVEAKQDASYKLRDALAELEEARKNRDASVGLFVFSAASAPPGLAPFARHGDDIVVVWDAEDPRTDVVLTAGLSVAKALCARARVQGAAEAADFETIERAILDIQKQASGLDQISSSAQTIKNGSEKILERARIMREGLAEQIGVLTEGVQDLKALVNAADGAAR